MNKKTKIVATISDKSCEVEFIRTLFEAGMDVVRINSAHITIESATQVINNVRQVSDQIAILIDTKGPEIRTNPMSPSCSNGVEVKEGDKVKVMGSGKGDLSDKKTIYVNDAGIYEDVPVGASLLIDDGDIELEVVGKHDSILECIAKNSGIIKGRKSVNVPNVSIELPSLTARDAEFVNWAIDNDIDFIAHSFVRSKHDILAVQEILDKRNSHIKIISKIENKEGIDNIDEILDHTYGIMVARGDLGVELPAEQIPGCQRDIVKKCIESKKPVIIATQMLHTMITNPRPTRAEVSDVANAIYQRVDAVMLSGETANGLYPLEAVQTMAKIAREVEKNNVANLDITMVRINNEVTAQLSRSAVRASVNLPIKAIVIDTLSGRTGRYLSAFRGDKPVYAACYRKNVMRELALSYGIQATYHEPSECREHFLYNILNSLEKENLLSKEDMIVVIGGSFGAAKGASFMEIGKVLHLEHKSMC